MYKIKQDILSGSYFVILGYNKHVIGAGFPTKEQAKAFIKRYQEQEENQW